MISTTLDERGRIVQLTPAHDLIYGERSGVISARVTALDGLMQGAGFSAQASETIVADMWEKWVTLAALGGITCLMRGTIGEVAAVPGGAAFAAAFLDECGATALAAGSRRPRNSWCDRGRP